MAEHRRLDTKVLTRVEGEGALEVDIDDGKVTRVHLRIYEPPRFFEAFLKGRHFQEVPDHVARICGICPVAYQMSAVHALEDAFAVDLPEHLRKLRRLFYCGEWIESHALHVYLLHAPDFLGYPSGIAMAKDHPDAVKRGLRLKKIGNALLEALGGRAVHPISPCVGGFHGLPPKEALQTLAEDLAWGIDAARETVKWVSDFTFPAFTQPYDFVSLKPPEEYPMNHGELAGSDGLTAANGAWEEHFEEVQVPHSTALHARRKGGGAYLVGPMARLFHNHEQLMPAAKAVMDEVGFRPAAETNPFRSIVARGVELVHAFEEALSIVQNLPTVTPPHVPVTPRAGEGRATTEAPRGILYHRYVVDENGLIQEAVITPPTSQNQGQIEADLWRLVEENMDRDDAALKHLCEFFIRNYDPCISCSAHFLKLTVNRGK